MMSGGGDHTPTTPSSTPVTPTTPLVPFLSHSGGGGGGMRYPLYATVQQLQGSPLLYSPAMFGNIGLPWRPLGSGGQVCTSSSTQMITSAPPNTVVNVPNISSLSQIQQAGLVYPIGMPMLTTTPKQQLANSRETKKNTDVPETCKRRSELVHHNSEIKRPRLSDSIPHSPSLTSSSPSSHPTTPTHLHKSQQQTSMQRSPVIKFIPYSPGQQVVLPTHTGSPRITLPQTIVLPASNVQTTSHQTPPLKTSGSPNVILSSSQQLKHKQQNYNIMGQVVGGRSEAISAGSGTEMGPKLTQVTAHLPPPSLPDNLHIVLLKCFGHLPEAILNHPNITVSGQLQDLYRQSYHATSNFDPLSPESACSLTIGYLNTLRPGEGINMETLRTMIQYAQFGETDWIQYYKKHKKMSESTYVQSQLMHLARLAVYPTQGKVHVRTLQQNLGDGLLLTLYDLFITNSYTSQNVPEYIVVIAFHPSSTIDFCVLLIEPLQVLRMRETKLVLWLDSKRRKQLLVNSANPPNGLPKGTLLPAKLTISKEILTSLLRHNKSLNGNAQVPFRYSKSLTELDPIGIGSSLESIQIPVSLAESLVPTSSHVIDHKPIGPFPEQCKVAVFLLQKILACFNSGSTIERFHQVDFRVLCPPDGSFVGQVVSDIINSGVVEHLQSSQSPSRSDSVHCTNSASTNNCTSNSQTELSPQAEVEQRVICCNLSEDSPRFENLLQDLENNQDTLFLVIIENAHLTTKITSRMFSTKSRRASIPHDSSPDPALCISDCTALLKNFNNCVFLNVSSHPYSLQSNHSLITTLTNQIHWPIPFGKTEADGQFCSAFTFHSYLASNDLDNHFGVRFREDACFEELFHKAAVELNHCHALSQSILSLRAQLLLDQYILSLLATVGQVTSTNCGSPLPETLTLVNELVRAPLLNQKGHGKMLIIRSHDVSIAHQFYSKLKTTRDSLGLQFRFEIIFDDGSHLLSVSDYFVKRISKLRELDTDTCRVASYKDLDNLPCIVVLAGFLRAGLSFPRSLYYVDLRLCFPIGQVTRSCYEYDTSFFNGYYSNSKKTNESITSIERIESNVHDKKVEQTVTAVLDDNEDSVFESNGNFTATDYAQQPQQPIDVYKRTSSSSLSSHRSSSFEDMTSKCHDPLSQCSSARGEAVVISWNPDATVKESVGSSSSSSGESMTDSQMEPLNDVPSPDQSDDHIPDCNFSSSGTVTVTIDPPDDRGHYYSSDIVPIEIVTQTSVSDSSSFTIPFSVTAKDNYEDINDLRMESLDSDSEDDGEDETRNPSRVCVLSRPYYHIWSSPNQQQHLLLPPSPGISWVGGHRRPPLYDPDPQQQSQHYYKQSKPTSSNDRIHLETVSKETSAGSARRFLLSGSPQTGKTGAWLLLVRFLHDHLCSSHRVIVETASLKTSIFLQSRETSEELSCSRSQKLVSPVEDLSCFSSSKHSKIVSMEYLAKHLCNGVDSKPDQKFKLPKVAIGKKSGTRSITESPSTASGFHQHSQSTVSTTVSINISPYMAYDFTHSCNDCAPHKRTQVSTNGHSAVQYLESYLPLQAGPPLLIRWQIPASQLKHCVSVTSAVTKGPILNWLKLPRVVEEGGSAVKTPVFIPTVDRDLTGLFNLFHSRYEQLEILVTVQSQFKKYCKAWPNQIVMSLPDSEAVGLGTTYHTILRFAHYNYQLNIQHESHSVWPTVAIMSDNIAMWKKMDYKENKLENISMADVLLSLEQTSDCTQYAAMSVLPWSEDLSTINPSIDGLTNFDLSHDFILLNLAKIADVSYNQFSFNSSDIGFNLDLKAVGLKTKLRKDLMFVRKHLPTGGNLYPLHSLATSLSADIDKVVISLHHDSSCHLPYPGPYLMEHYLLHKSQTLFPYAHESSFPVLVIDNYISLGPQIHVMMANSESLQNLYNSSLLPTNNLSTTSERSEQFPVSVCFGGLLLYLCEGKLESEQLERLNFIRGSCLCLVTRDCKTLVQEVARLDLEEKWKFRLRDEYQTACADEMKPLFFLIGRYEG